jgi:hypothetical protein
MNEALSTSACLLGRFGLFGLAPVKSGELSLANGVVTFTPREPADRGAAFSVPAEAVKVRSPVLYFGVGLQLVVGGTRHRVCFLPLRSAVGDTRGVGEDKSTIVAGNKFHLDELRPARSTTRTWRDALSKARA